MPVCAVQRMCARLSFLSFSSDNLLVEQQAEEKKKAAEDKKFELLALGGEAGHSAVGRLAEDLDKVQVVINKFPP
jgi:hypothetical protein